jgi:predicted nucleotide-binding protein
MTTCDSTRRSKPTVFIGSSAEGLAAARFLKDCLEPELGVVLWSDNLFELGEDTLTSLLKFVSVFDFGVFVLGRR